MSSTEDLHQLDLRYPDLNKIDCNHAHHSPSPLNPITKQKAQKNSSPSNELQLQHMKLPLKLPQRRKFITLAEANSASYGLNFHVNGENLASLSDKGSSGLQKALDLAVAEGEEEDSKQVELPAMTETKEEAVHETSEMMKTKKKLLVQLAENPGAIVDSQSKNQRNESSFHGSSNPSRTCRFCGREFPSGRALGGHMRVHGALLVADTSTNMVEQERRDHGELETLGSTDHMAHLSHRRQEEELKLGSFTSSSSSQVNSARPNQENKVDRNGQEDDEEEEQDEGEGEKANRMVRLSSFECTSLVSKPGEELLGYGDVSSELILTGKRKPASALYELRRNPKPNQRFFRDQELGVSNAIWPASSSAARRSRSPSPEHAHPCFECGKVFLSWKALFGHMRCHPERDWRGIQPPPEHGLELDCTLRSITPKVSYTGISCADNITNCELAGSVMSVVVNKEEITAKVQKDASLKSNMQVLDESAATVGTKETASSLARKGVGSCLDIEPRQRDAVTEFEQGEDNTQGPSFKKANKKNITKRAADYVARSSKEATDDWSPSWPTGKRSKRSRIAHSQYEPSLTSETTSNELRLSQHTTQFDDQEDLDMANCLVLLSNDGNNTQEADRAHWELTVKSAFSTHHGKKRRGSTKGVHSQTAPKDDADVIQAHGAEVLTHERGDMDDAGEDDDNDEVGNKVAILAAGEKAENYGSLAALKHNSGVKYQCLTCKKCFNSHQALGGHRASHKKMKGCFAQNKNLAKEAQESSEENVTEDDFGTEQFRWQGRAHRAGGPSQQEEERAISCIDSTPKLSSKKKVKGHECSICHRIFATGQALGGHKRCHWNGERYVADTASVASSNNKQPSLEEKSEWACKDDGIKLAKEDAIDLNLPAPLDEDDDAALDRPTQDAPVYGGLLPKTENEGQAVGSLMDYSGSRRKLNDGSDDWMVKDLLRENGGSAFLRKAREIEGGCRFDRRPPMWNQKWENAAGTQISEVCSLQSL